MKENNIKVKKKLTKKKKILIIIGSFFVTIFATGLFLLYGPISYFRDLLITSAMTTLNHQYLATMFYDDKTIQEVLSKHKVIEGKGSTDLNLIDIDNNKINVYQDKYDKEILKRENKNDIYKIIDIKGKTYSGYLVAIYDPSKVSLASTKYLGKNGQPITTMAKENNAVIAINGGGFSDPGWMGNGGQPTGIVIKDSKIISNTSTSGMTGGIIGFTNDNKLFLGKITGEEAIKKGVRDAVDFGPFLIVNGKPSFIKGNGGWGIAPRTAIGQRKDGIVLFLVIDGRRAHSVGADMVDLTEIMQNYKAYNAANLDGGSSTCLVEKNKIVNIPVASGKDGLRNIANAWIVKG